MKWNIKSVVVYNEGIKDKLEYFPNITELEGLTEYKTNGKGVG